jgi:hypothetical protein
MKVKRTLNYRVYYSWINEYVGALVFSRLFSNTVIPNDPQAMSNFGLLMIVVWDSPTLL